MIRGDNSGNSRNGTRRQDGVEGIGPVEIEVPRGYLSVQSAEPQIVRKRQRRLAGVDEIVALAHRAGVDDWGDRRAFPGGVWREISKDTVSQDHREGHRRDDRVAEPAVGEGLSGDLSTRWSSRFATGRSITSPSTWVIGGLTRPDWGRARAFAAVMAARARSSGSSVFTEIKNRGVQDV